MHTRIRPGYAKKGTQPMSYEPSRNQKESLFTELVSTATSGGYHLNPDRDFTDELLTGLLINNKRYGYMSCPCRLGTGNKKEDLDIICPCIYRDADLNDFNSCYCGLYVSHRAIIEHLSVTSIPERRGQKQSNEKEAKPTTKKMKFPIWRCTVCGYLCARIEAPETCPICKAEQNRFEKFID